MLRVFFGWRKMVPQIVQKNWPKNDGKCNLLKRQIGSQFADCPRLHSYGQAYILSTWYIHLNSFMNICFSVH